MFLLLLLWSFLLFGPIFFFFFLSFSLIFFFFVFQFDSFTFLLVFFTAFLLSFVIFLCFFSRHPPHLYNDSFALYFVFFSLHLFSFFDGVVMREVFFPSALFCFCICFFFFFFLFCFLFFVFPAKFLLKCRKNIYKITKVLKYINSMSRLLLTKCWTINCEIWKVITSDESMKIDR